MRVRSVGKCLLGRFVSKVLELYISFEYVLKWLLIIQSVLRSSLPCVIASVPAFAAAFGLVDLVG